MAEGAQQAGVLCRESAVRAVPPHTAPHCQGGCRAPPSQPPAAAVFQAPPSEKPPSQLVPILRSCSLSRQGPSHAA